MDSRYMPSFDKLFLTCLKAGKILAFDKNRFEAIFLGLEKEPIHQGWPGRSKKPDTF